MLLFLLKLKTLVLSRAVFYSQPNSYNLQKTVQYEECSKSAMDHFHWFLLKVYRINMFFRFAMKFKISLMSNFDE